MYVLVSILGLRQAILRSADNPTDTVAGNQHWGHASSRDLYHWENHPIAIFPSNISEGIFSGSAVIDVNNTSGFFPGQSNGVVAIYTIHTPYQQSQALAYSTDNGYSFTKYVGNPVLTAGSKNFRDPKVIWHAKTGMWVMVVAYPLEFTIGIFTSSNLLNWAHRSNFTGSGLLGYQWECPGLQEMPMAGSTSTIYILYVSINPGAPLGGSIGQYFPGTFNGSHFTAVDSATRVADFGKDNYANQFFYGISGDQPQISIAWASNWQQANYVPTGPLEGWQSAMSLPRRNYLKNVTRTGYTLISEPYGLDAVMVPEPLARNSSLDNNTLLVEFGGEGRSGAVMLEMNITSLNTSMLSNTASANFTFLSSMSGEKLSGGLFLTGDATFFLDRGKVRGFENPFATDKVSAANILTDFWEMKVVVDRSVWEVFLLGGEKSATLTIFPEYPLDTLVVKSSGLNQGAKVSVTVWELESVWVTHEQGTGYLRGNSTARVKRDIMGGMEMI
jgi:beta-fructofuranosidase